MVTVTGNMQKKIWKVQPHSGQTGRLTNKHTNRHTGTHHNTLQPYWGEVIMFVYLEFLLVNGKVAGLDVEKPTAAETQHVFVLRVPRHTVGVWLLQWFIHCQHQTHIVTTLFSRTTRVSWHQKGKTILDFNEARDDGVEVASAGAYAS